ncbi:MAG: helix-turn-helix transcriptional regulator [Burkholderiales bacterium]|nr:helix-turn-helix transcriptional regulator [Burkholderiales bacterium]
MYNILSDKDFFELYIKSADITYNNGDEEIIFIKDANFKFSYLSPGYLKGFQAGGTISEEKILGLVNTVYPKGSIQALVEEVALKQDMEIKSSLKPAKFLYIDIYNRIGLIRKRPIINPATNNFVGIIGNVSPLLLPNILDMLYKMNGIRLGLANSECVEPLQHDLTPRQHVILFLYLNRYSATDISSILTTLGQKISAGRVNNHLENLKYIFAAKTKEQLIEKAISLKYHLFIPRQLLQIGSFPLEDEVLISEQ